MLTNGETELAINFKSTVSEHCARDVSGDLIWERGWYNDKGDRVMLSQFEAARYLHLCKRSDFSSTPLPGSNDMRGANTSEVQEQRIISTEWRSLEAEHVWECWLLCSFLQQHQVMMGEAKEMVRIWNDVDLNVTRCSNELNKAKHFASWNAFHYTEDTGLEFGMEDNGLFWADMQSFGPNGNDATTGKLHNMYKLLVLLLLFFILICHDPCTNYRLALVWGVHDRSGCG